MPRGRQAHICACTDCGRSRRHYAKGLCGSCYRRDLFNKAEAVPCPQCGRSKARFAKGVCRSCYTNNRKRARVYGITPEQYVEMLKDQRGRCPICEEPLKRQPHVDHCHATGAIRSLLCYKCNVGLGSFGDDPERLRAAAKYIEAHRARKVA